ncbi:hypothetical protein [Antribacter gilvus]|uniref:hypothetical protein n=1 Tax=Antribacter gilvus TaxID=2304675 RepID=UPI000F7AB141|nr:hypothetical protein [Antribacter gilvus]
MPGDELLPPVGYSGWWTAAGLGLILLSLALVAAVIWFTRASAAEKEAQRFAVPPAAGGRHHLDPHAGIRDKYTRTLSELRQRYESGELDRRAVHHALAREMRAFAAERLDRDVSTLTLAQIAELDGAKKLTDLISRYYRPEFAEDDDPSVRRMKVDTSFDRAQEVVREW